MYRDLWKCAKYMRALHNLSLSETDRNLEKTQACAEQCGAIGMKLLQFLVSTDRFFSAEYRSRLRYLLEDNAHHSFEHTAKTYEHDFGRSIRDDFVISEQSDPVPIGSGTIGQVYRLYSKTLQEYVAVKVKHPDVDEQAHRFRSSIMLVIRIVEKFTVLPFTSLINEFLTNIDTQLDYNEEANCMIKIREKVADEPHIIIPKVISHSTDFIIMTFHEGTPYSAIKDERIRKLVSIDVYLFMLSSFLIYDLIHCDLHMGNWKVVIHDDGTYSIIMYDFGLTASICNAEIAKQIVVIGFNDDFMSLAKIVVHDYENQPLWPKYRDIIMNIDFVNIANYGDRYAVLLNKGMALGLPFNPLIIRVIQGLLLCMKVINVTRENLAKMLGKKGNCTEVMLCYNRGLVKKLGKYTKLGEVFQQWIDDDPRIMQVFDSWLYDTFGHHDSSVFVDITVDGLVL